MYVQCSLSVSLGFDSELEIRDQSFVFRSFVTKASVKTDELCKHFNPPITQSILPNPGPAKKTYHHPNSMFLSSFCLFNSLINDQVHERIKTSQDSIYSTSTVQLHLVCQKRKSEPLNTFICSSSYVNAQLWNWFINIL